MNKQTNAIYCILLMLTVWCTCNSVKNNKISKFAKDVYSECRLAIREISFLTDRLTSLELIEPEVITKEVEVIKEVPVIEKVYVQQSGGTVCKVNCGTPTPVPVRWGRSMSS